MAKKKKSRTNIHKADVCKSKAVYLSFETAYKVIEFEGMIGVQEPYECESCGKFHVHTMNRKIHVKRRNSKVSRDKELTTAFKVKRNPKKVDWKYKKLNDNWE